MATREENDARRIIPVRKKIQEQLYAVFKTSNGDWGLMMRVLREMREKNMEHYSGLVLYEMYVTVYGTLFGRELKDTDFLQSDWEVLKP